MKPKRIKQLEELASNLIGDGKSPNLFFVTHQGNVILISRDFDIAYKEWKSVTSSSPCTEETSLEDRKTGVLASREPEEEGSRKLVVVDDTDLLRK